MAETFFRKPLTMQMAEFATYSMERQYTVFICGNQVIHPPALYLAEPFARNGKKAVKLLIEKLEQTNTDLTTRDIVLVFAEMERLKTYDVAADDKLVNLIADSIRNMDSDWKESSERLLMEIVSGAESSESESKIR